MSSSEESPDEKMLQHLHGDAVRALDKKLDSYRGLAGRALSLLQINGVVLALIVNAADKIGQGFLKSPFTLLAISPFLLSATFALAGYWFRPVSIGLGSADVSKSISEKLDETEYLWWISVKGYSEWLDEVEKSEENRRSCVRTSTALFFVGIVSILVYIIIFIAVVRGG